MNYRIKYDYGALTDKEIIVKNVSGELHAKISLNAWLERKHGVGELKVYSCVKDFGNGFCSGDFGAFNDIFGGIFK